VFGLFSGAAMVMFENVPTGFLPLEDKGVLFADVKLPDGASLQRTEEVVARIVDMAKASDGVADVISFSSFSIIGGNGSNVALVIAILDPWDERTASNLAWYRFLGVLNQKLATIPEANAFAFPVPPVSGLENSGGVEAELQNITGGSSQELASVASSFIFHLNQLSEVA